MDRRGYGCSERFSPHDVDPLEVHVDDAIAVLDAVGSERAAFFSFDEGTFIGCLLAASRPDRISHLAMLDPSPCWTSNEEIPWEWSAEQWRVKVEQDRRDWGSYEAFRRDDPDTPERTLRWEAKFNRQSQSPGAGAAEALKYSATDVRAVLPSIRVPTLVVHGKERPSTSIDVRSPRYVADHIPGARFVEIAAGHFPWGEGSDLLTDEIEGFLTGTRSHPSLERVLTTILFTDIVGSTHLAAEIGDQAWRDVRRKHHDIVRLELDRFRGHERDTAGDGFFATFDGPARAVRCAQAIEERVQTVGSRYGRAFIPGRSRSPRRDRAASACTSAHGLRPSRDPTRCGRRRPFEISPPDQDWCSRTSASTSSRVFLTPGGCIGSTEEWAEPGPLCALTRRDTRCRRLTSRTSRRSPRRRRASRTTTCIDRAELGCDLGHGDGRGCGGRS